MDKDIISTSIKHYSIGHVTLKHIDGYCVSCSSKASPLPCIPQVRAACTNCTCGKRGLSLAAIARQQAAVAEPQIAGKPFIYIFEYVELGSVVLHLIELL